MSKSITIHESSGNVFADIGIPDPEEYLAKSALAARIQAAIEDRGLTQKAAGELLGLTQPNVSNLLRGRLDAFSTDRLFRILIRLGSNIEIRVSEPDPGVIGHVSVLSSGKRAARQVGRKEQEGEPVPEAAKVPVAPVNARRKAGSSS